MSQAGIWPLIFEAQGIEVVKSMVAGLVRDLDAYATAGDAFGGSMAKAMEQAFGAGRKAALDFKPVPEAIIAINERLRATMAAINADYESGAITRKRADSLIETAAGGALRASKQAGEALGAQEAAARKLGSAFGVVSGSMMGFIRAGAQGTAEWNYFGQTMQLINREVANLFKPAIDGAIDAADRLFGALRSLTPEQQRLAGGVALATVGILGMATVLPRVIEGFSALKAVVAAFNTTLMANPIIAVGAVLAAMVLSTEEGREAFMELGRAVMPLFTEMANALRPILHLVGELAKSFSQLVAPAIRGVAQDISDLIRQYRELRGITTIEGGAEARVRRVERGEMTREQAMADARHFDELEHQQETLMQRWARSFDFLSPLGTFMTFFGNNTSRQDALQRRLAGGTRQELTPAGGGFENVENLYRRLTSASANRDFERRTADNTEETARILARIDQNLHGHFEGRGNPRMFPAVPGP